MTVSGGATVYQGKGRNYRKIPKISPSLNVFEIDKPPRGGLNPFDPGDFAEKCVLKLVEWFSGHCRAIKS